MGHSDLDPAVHDRRPWNAGQNVGPKRPLKPRDIWAIRFYLDEHKRLVDEWVSTVGLDKREYGTHSMRRTKASLICKATGNLRAIQILLGHTNIENTVRYLGVDVDDALTLSE
ncbi:hypothetical protein D5I55_12965 [Chakrabartia godavariana]|nr:hypothetical protein D5I55_12965 [Chakrabartia godavariana]